LHSPFIFSPVLFNGDYVIASAFPPYNLASSLKLAFHEHVFIQFHKGKRLLFNLASLRRDA
ncbi:hypothetical protein OM255_13170, partial [Escherichia albertii]|nr:hypothetical protein [Escherichia albertii]MCZ8612871.1 hypothetical protein [Escherichia albertii]MCZ8621302.1 hypothetical protein [Escherichia albertii]MCZ8644759.1 hypothetical protein [Escherichia albertii]MCZ8680206.1 hypothetical protein [Escherichia albertii]